MQRYALAYIGEAYRPYEIRGGRGEDEPVEVARATPSRQRGADAAPSRQARPVSRRGGFTLMELLAVITILGIVASVAILSAQDNQAVVASAAARMIAGDLEYAQSLAISEQSDITVTFNTDTDSYTLTDSDSAPITHPLNKADFTITLPTEFGESSLDLSEAEFATGNSSVGFDETGTPYQGGTSGTAIVGTNKVQVTCGGKTYNVTVGPVTGRIVVAKQ